MSDVAFVVVHFLCNTNTKLLGLCRFVWADSFLIIHFHSFTSIIPASAILFILGTISAYTFHLLGRLCQVEKDEAIGKGLSAENSQLSRAGSIGELWDYEVGSSSSWLVSLAIILTCYGTSLAYSIILGDTFKSMAETVGLTVSSIS